MSVMGAHPTGTAGTAGTVGTVVEDREPRVRELARDAVTLMAFSAGVSLSVFLVVLLGSWLGR
jgi:hypothetical protein